MKVDKNRSKYEIIYEPYRLTATDTFDDMLKRFIDHDNSLLIQDDLIYYQAFQIIRTTINGHCLIVALSNQIELRLGDKVIDNHNNTFEVKGFEMVRLSSGSFPNWYNILSFVMLQGNTENVGEFFAKQAKE